MATSEPASDFTSLTLRRGVKERLEEIKPYDSLSWGEFVEELAEVYEQNQG